MDPNNNWRGDGVEQEVRAFTEYLNMVLVGDPTLQAYLPIPLDGGIFEAIKPGLLLCRVLLLIDPESIDEKKIILAPQNYFEVIQNHELALDGARKAGMVLVNVGAKDLSEGKVNLCLGVVAQCVRCLVLSKVNVRRHPSLLGLVDEAEGVEEFVNMPAEIVILRWMNFHLEKANHPRRVFNFDTDLQDCENYIVLLNQLNPVCETSILQSDASDLDKAAYFLAHAEAMGCRVFLQPEDILAGRTKLNMGFLANLLDRHVQMQSISDMEKVNEAIELEKSVKEKMAQQENDLKDWMGKEEERFRSWMENEEKRMKEGLEQETAEQKKIIDEERAKVEKEKEKMEREKKELEEKQQEFARQQSMTMRPPSPQQPSPYPTPTTQQPSPYPSPYPPNPQSPYGAPPPGYPGYGPPPPGYPGYQPPPPGYQQPPPPGYQQPPPPGYQQPPPPGYQQPPPPGYQQPPLPGYQQPPPPSGYRGPPPAAGLSYRPPPQPAPVAQPPPAAHPPPSAPPQQVTVSIQKSLGDRWKHGNIICLNSLMTGSNMRINKGGGIDAKGWSFKISQWMVERTKTQAIKFRNVGNEGMYLLCYQDRLTFGSGEGKEAEFLVRPQGSTGGRKPDPIYSLQSIHDVGIKVGFRSDSLPVAPTDGRKYEQYPDRLPKQFLFTMKVQKAV